MVSLVDPCASYQMGRSTRAHVKPCSGNVIRKVKTSSQCKKRNSLGTVWVRFQNTEWCNSTCTLIYKRPLEGRLCVCLGYGYQPKYPAEKRYYNIYVQHGSMHQKPYMLTAVLQWLAVLLAHSTRPSWLPAHRVGPSRQFCHDQTRKLRPHVELCLIDVRWRL